MFYAHFVSSWWFCYKPLPFIPIHLPSSFILLHKYKKFCSQDYLGTLQIRTYLCRSKITSMAKCQDLWSMMQLWCTNVSEVCHLAKLLSDKFSTRAIVHDRQTRYRDSLNIPSCRINAANALFATMVWKYGIIILGKSFKRCLINELICNMN